MGWILEILGILVRQLFRPKLQQFERLRHDGMPQSETTEAELHYCGHGVTGLKTRWWFSTRTNLFEIIKSNLMDKSKSALLFASLPVTSSTFTYCFRIGENAKQYFFSAQRMLVARSRQL